MLLGFLSLTSGAVARTTSHPKVIQDFCKWPNANVSVVTGATSGIFVIQVDTKEGHDFDGLASIKALEAEHGMLVPTANQIRTY